jgi:hypothetical protein
LFLPLSFGITSKMLADYLDSPPIDVLADDVTLAEVDALLDRVL